MKIMIKFHGVRGSLARPGKNTTIYGGNTPCLEIRFGKELIICDCGTGIYEIGRALSKKQTNATILFSHYHWDHIIGLPFFMPIYDKRNRFTIIGRKGLRLALKKLLSPPNFPARIGDFKSKIKLVEKRAGTFKIGKIRIEAFDVNHPNGAFGYRFVFPGKKSAVFISDNGPEADNSKLIKKIYGTDLLIHDAQYLPEEYLERKKFGHSTYHYVLDIAKKAGIKNIVLFHHDPSRTDAELGKIEAAAKKLTGKIGLKAKISVAREGKRLTLS